MRLGQQTPAATSLCVYTGAFNTHLSSVFIVMSNFKRAYAVP